MRRGLAVPERLRVGVMFEVPALAWQLDTLLPHVDFISVGTNDLVAVFVRGRSREYAVWPDATTPCRPALLRLLHFVVEKTRPAGVDSRLWRDGGPSGRGAGAPRPRRAHACRWRPAPIGPVKAMVRSLDLEEATDFVTSVSHNRSAACARRCACSRPITRSKFSGGKPN